MATVIQEAQMLLLRNFWGDSSAVTRASLVLPWTMCKKRKRSLFLISYSYCTDCLLNFIAGNQERLIKCVSYAAHPIAFVL